MGTLEVTSKVKLPESTNGFRPGDILRSGDDVYQFLVYRDGSPIAVRIGGRYSQGGGIYQLSHNGNYDVNGNLEAIVVQPVMVDVILHSLANPGKAPSRPEERNYERGRKLECLQLPLFGFEELMLDNVKLERPYWPE